MSEEIALSFPIYSKPKHVNPLLLQEPIIRLETNGDIFVKGKLVENDKEVVDGMRELLRSGHVEDEIKCQKK